MSVDDFDSGSIRGIYFSDPLTEQNFLPISLTHSHFGNLLFFKYQNGSRDLHTKGMSIYDTPSFAMNGEWEILNFSHSKTL